MKLSHEQILPIPDMSECVLGVCIWKGETLWLVDLNHLVGNKSVCQQSQLLETLNVIVVRNSGQTLGLIVEAVSDIDLFDEGKMQVEPGLCPLELEPFVLSHFPQQDGIVLDVPSIINAPQLHAYREQS